MQIGGVKSCNRWAYHPGSVSELSVGGLGTRCEGGLALLKGEGEGEGCSMRLVCGTQKPLTLLLSPCEGERRNNGR